MLPDEDPLSRILKASKKHIKQREEEEEIKELTDAIGDRRLRDIHDIVIQIEQKYGWDTVVRYMKQSAQNRYSSPLIAGPTKLRLEPLKFREMIFALFSCSGLEPINIDTLDLLDFLGSELSFVKATSAFLSRVKTKAEEQIKKEDILFFDLYNHINPDFEGIRNAIENIKQSQIMRTQFSNDSKSVDIEPLWYTEIGRCALSSLGITGVHISIIEFESVISVLQVSPDTISHLRRQIDIDCKQDALELSPPINKQYHKLLKSTIYLDIERLTLLGSRHPTQIILAKMRLAIDNFRSNESSEIYRELLGYVTNLLLLRSTESILILEEMLELQTPRLTTLAALALGNYYHESAVTLLSDIICRTTDENILRTATKSLFNVFDKLPEAMHFVSEKIESSSCRNLGRLKQVYRKMTHQRPQY